MIRTKSYLTFLLSLAVSTLFAQSAVLFPHLNEVQQVLQRNPAKPFDAKVSMALGSAFVGYRNDLFDIGVLDNDLPALPEFESIVLAHKQTEKINLNTRVDLLGFSILTEVGRFSVGLSQRADVKLAVPEELTNYLFLGDSYLQNKQLEVSDLRAEASSFIEVALRYQTPVLENGLRFGGSLKILGGQGHGVVSDAFGKTSNLGATDTFLVEANGRVRSSGPAAFGSDTTLGIRHLLTKPNNMGLGMDLGLHYQADDIWSFGLSVLDVGFIRWKRRVYDAEFGAKFRSVGFPKVVSGTANLEELANSLDGLIIDEPFPELKPPDDYGESYTRALFPTVVGSVDAVVSDNFGVGMTYAYDADGLRGEHSLGLNASANAGEYVQALVGYSFAGPKHSGLGIGFVLALGPLQVHATADNVFDLVNQDELNGVAVNAGANLIFPMVWFGESGRMKKRKGKSKPVKCYKF